MIRVIGACLMSGLMTMASAAGAKLDTAKIELITGMKGNFNQKENVFKVSMPRADVPISVDGWTMPPFMGLGPWAAFTPHHGSMVMVMGDMVLFQDPGRLSRRITARW